MALDVIQHGLAMVKEGVDVATRRIQRASERAPLTWAATQNNLGGPLF